MLISTKTFTALPALARYIRDQWVFRPGRLTTPTDLVRVRANWTGEVHRIPRGKITRFGRHEFKRSAVGLFVPLHERFAWHNAVVNEGLNDLLDVTLSGATQDSTWFVGHTDDDPTFAAGDTLASHAGWTEFTDFDETNRIAFVDAGASGQALSNSASPAVITSSSDSNSVGGAFLAGVNTGTAGRLFAGGAFGSNKALDEAETLSTTATFTAAAV